MSTASPGAVLAPRGTTPMRFTIETFDVQSIANARLMPDGPAIVFSSPQTGNAVHLFEIRACAIAARAFRAAHARSPATHDDRNTRTVIDAVARFGRIISQ